MCKVRKYDHIGIYVPVVTSAGKLHFMNYDITQFV